MLQLFPLIGIIATLPSSSERLAQAMKDDNPDFAIHSIGISDSARSDSLQFFLLFALPDIVSLTEARQPRQCRLALLTAPDLPEAMWFELSSHGALFQHGVIRCFGRRASWLWHERASCRLLRCATCARGPVGMYEQERS